MPAVLSTLSVVTPAALWALLILAIPLAIHLFSRSRGRLVHTGHIDLIRQARKLRVTELKLTQWLLLALRLLIFALAALILAGLTTAGLRTSDTDAIYVTPAWVKTASAQDIDVLMAEAEKAPGSDLFLLQDGFPRINRQQLEAARREPPANPDAFRISWALLSDRLSLDHHAGEVTVYATDHALQFGSGRPALPGDIEWRIGQNGQTHAVRPEPVSVVVAHGQNRSAEASQVISALRALKEHRLPALSWNIQDSTELDDKPPRCDWLIYLDDDRLDPAFVEGITGPMVILTDAGGDSIESTVQFVQIPFYPFSNFRLDRFTADGSVNASNDQTVAGAVLLKAADGSPLLQEHHYGQVRLLRFNSRFAAAWNSLARQVEFPELLLQLMSNPATEPLRYADARIDPANLHATAAGDAPQIPLPRRSLQGLLATLLVLAWLTERWLSERRNREEP